jgi:hypothetical protein
VLGELGERGAPVSLSAEKLDRRFDHPASGLGGLPLAQGGAVRTSPARGFGH